MPEPQPVAVYFDTNILLRLPVELASADFLQLKELCQLLNLSLAVPEACVKELVHKRKGTVQEAMGRARSAVSAVSQFMETVPSLDWHQEPAAILQNVEEVVKRHVLQQGITIVPTPDIPLQELLTMAVQKAKPFDESGRGFADAVIFFSVVEHAKRARAGYHLLVTDDRIFHDPEIAKLANDHGVNLRVADSLPSATKDLEQFVSAAVKEVRAERSQRLKAILEERGQEIEKYVRANGVFSPNFLLDTLLTLTWTVEKIEDVKFVEVQQAQSGYPPGGGQEGRVQISFDAKFKFVLLLKHWVAARRQEYRVGTLQPDLRELFSPGLQEEIVTQEVERVVNLEGSIYLVRPYTYSDLQLEKIEGDSVF